MYSIGIAYMFLVRRRAGGRSVGGPQEAAGSGCSAHTA